MKNLCCFKINSLQTLEEKIELEIEKWHKQHKK